MSDTKSNNQSLLFSILSFLVGVFIGLVVLGWWLFPVQWTGGTLQHVDPQIQEEWLRMAIDSYSLNQDQELAQARYDALGPQKEAVLVAIREDPGDQNPTSIVDFGLAVGVENLAALEASPATTAQAPSNDLPFGMAVARPILAALLVLLCLFALGILAVIFLVLRSSSQRGLAEQAPPPAPEDQRLPDEAETFDLAAEETRTSSPESPWDELSPSEIPTSEEPALDTVEPEAGMPLAAGLGAAAWAVSAATDEETSPPPELELEPEAGVVDETFPTSLPPDTSEVWWRATSDTELPPLVDELEPETLPGEEASTPISINTELPPLADEASAPPELLEPSITEIVTVEPEYEQESLHDLVAKFKQDPTYVEGIGDAYAQKLAQAGVLTLKDLLEKGSTPRGRQEIAEASAISPKLILRWVNHVDLFRIKGVGQEYADLLESAGVDTVPELAMRNAGNLFEKMLSINEEKKLVRKPPVLSQVQSWIEQAKRLPRVISY